MGKKKHCTQAKISGQKTHLLEKKKQGSSKKKGFSTSHIAKSNSHRNHKIAKNVYFALRDLSNVGK